MKRNGDLPRRISNMPQFYVTSFLSNNPKPEPQEQMEYVSGF